MRVVRGDTQGNTPGDMSTVHDQRWTLTLTNGWPPLFVCNLQFRVVSSRNLPMDHEPSGKSTSKHEQTREAQNVWNTYRNPEEQQLPFVVKQNLDSAKGREWLGWNRSEGHCRRWRHHWSERCCRRHSWRWWIRCGWIGGSNLRDFPVVDWIML